MPSCPTPKKRAYDHHAQAFDVWKKMQAASGQQDLRPYKCQCGKYHVGKSPGLLQRRIIKSIGHTKKHRPKRRP